MPIPKVGDVISLALPDNSSWDQLRITGPTWSVESIATSRMGWPDLVLRSIATGEIVPFSEGRLSQFWPIAPQEITIQPFLTSVRNAIQSKENQPDEPASK